MAISKTKKIGAHFAKGGSKAKFQNTSALENQAKNLVKEMQSEFPNEMLGEAKEYVGESILLGGTTLSSMLFPDDATLGERLGRTAMGLGVIGSGIGAYAFHKGAKAANMSYGGYAKLQGNKAVNRIKGFLK